MPRRARSAPAAEVALPSVDELARRDVDLLNEPTAPPAEPPAAYGGRVSKDAMLTAQIDEPTAEDLEAEAALDGMDSAAEAEAAALTEASAAEASAAEAAVLTDAVLADATAPTDGAAPGDVAELAGPEVDLDDQTSTMGDSVHTYLKSIGRTSLLTAEQEVNLAKRIEAGLYAEHKLETEPDLPEDFRRELELVAEDGRRAKAHMLEANLRLVVSVA